MNTQNTLWNEMKNLNNVTETTNGDKAYKSTLNPLLDFMFTAASLRTAEEREIKKLFTIAYAYNAVYAVRLAFYIRDIRGGQGERRVFRVCMKTLSEIDPENFNKVMEFIPEYGRWDDLVDIMDGIDNARCQQTIVDIICKQFEEDVDNFHKNKPISLMAKWLPSENASAKATITKAKRLRLTIGLTSKEYRQILSSLRKYINIIERQITNNEWNTINYSHVPSKAMMKYKNAFLQHDNERFSQYIQDLSNPEKTEVKVNASTLYPFDIVKEANCCWGWNEISKQKADLLNAQWKALPDFFGDKFDNALVVADTSGSMDGNPIAVAVGLAMYLAERNKGLFHNKFITFSARPELQEIIGKDIVEKIVNLSKADWDSNTNIDAVFSLIYNAAKNKVTQEEMPSMIYIISDMQFDYCCNDNEDKTVFEKWQEKFEQAGYKLPTVVFWNVAEDNYGNVPITINNAGAIVCSGYSPSIVKYIMESDVSDTMQLVENIVNNSRYSNILA